MFPLLSRASPSGPSKRALSAGPSAPGGAVKPAKVKTVTTRGTGVGAGEGVGVAVSCAVGDGVMGADVGDEARRVPLTLLAVVALRALTASGVLPGVVTLR